MNSHTKRIKILMIKKDVSQKEIALLADCTEGMVSRVIKGSRKSLRIQRIISCKLDIPIDKIFPRAA